MKFFKKLLTYFAIFLFVAASLIAYKHYPSKSEMTILTGTSFVQVSSDPLERIFHIRYPGPPFVDNFNIFERIGLVEGAQFMDMQRYQVRIQIASVYKWDEVQPRIKKVIMEFEQLKAGEADDDGDEPEDLKSKFKI